MPVSHLVAATLIVLVSGWLQGAAGFGFNQLAVPLLLFLLPPARAILTVLILDLPTVLFLGWRLRRWLRASTQWPLLTGIAVGSVPAALLLTRLPEHPLKLFVSGVLALFAVLGLLGVRRRVQGNVTLATLGVGLIAGVLNASAGVSGPSMILFLVNQETEAYELRANLQSAFFVASAVALLVVARQPAVLAAPAYLAAWLVIPGLAGAWLGQRLSLRTEVLHRLGLIVVLLSSLLALGSALAGG